MRKISTNIKTYATALAIVASTVGGGIALAAPAEAVGPGLLCATDYDFWYANAAYPGQYCYGLPSPPR